MLRSFKGAVGARSAPEASAGGLPTATWSAVGAPAATYLGGVRRRVSREVLLMPAGRVLAVRVAASIRIDGMTATEVMERLEESGTAQNRKVYARHGMHEPFFGVSFAELGKLQKAIKTDHALARELWATGNWDARHLACMVADPRVASSRRTYIARRIACAKP